MEKTGKEHTIAMCVYNQELFIHLKAVVLFLTNSHIRHGQLALIILKMMSCDHTNL